MKYKAMRIWPKLCINYNYMSLKLFLKYQSCWSLTLKIGSGRFRLLTFSTTHSRDEDPILGKKPDPGLRTLNEDRFLKVYLMNILDNF